VDEGFSESIVAQTGIGLIDYVRVSALNAHKFFWNETERRWHNPEDILTEIGVRIRSLGY